MLMCACVLCTHMCVVSDVLCVRVRRVPFFLGGGMLCVMLLRGLFVMSCVMLSGLRCSSVCVCCVLCVCGVVMCVFVCVWFVV